MNNIIEFRNVTKTYQNFSLNGIDFDVPKGYITGFIGPNGSGKTTSIKLLLSMIHKESGSILINNQTLEENPFLSKIGIVMDESFLVKDWLIRDLSSILSPFYKHWDETLFKSYLKQFNIEDSYKVKELSKGMSTKLMLAIALSHDADLIILDEPTSGLDPSAREEICEILQNYVQDDQKSVLFSTHITSDLEAIADNIIFILEGDIIFNGIKDDLLEKYQIIKGGQKDLETFNPDALIGLKANSSFFEALVEKENFEAPKGILQEPCTLEQIITFFNREANHERTH